MSRAKIWLEVRCGCCGCLSGDSRFYRSPNDIRVLKDAVEDWAFTEDYGNTCPECLEKIQNIKRIQKSKGISKEKKCAECVFFSDREVGRNGGLKGICELKSYTGKRYGKTKACRFFKKDYEALEEK